ncbi:Lsr2 family protein [Microbacterium sp. MTN4-26]|uniref:histone-like nucleoid-structuring protein Lsr2 n=1 Tax=unclassified Microbacterium TaxID=2609290 RepID=UPI0036F3D4B3
MARRIVHQLVDDLDGSVLEVGDGETVLFSLDGTAYEIDLTDANAAAFREILAPYVDAARRVSGGRGGGSSSSAPRRRKAGQDYGAVRAWAKENGYQVSDRGRVPATVLEAYEAAR